MMIQCTSWLSSTKFPFATLVFNPSFLSFTAGSVRSLSTEAPFRNPTHVDSSSTANGYGNKGPLGRRAKQKEADREFFTHLLSSATTNRDAKAYLSRLKKPTTSKPPPIQFHAPQPRVNLGNLFGRGRAVEDTPVFTQFAAIEKGFEEQERLHVALVKISNVEELSERVLIGIAETLVQLNRLSMSPCVLLDSTEPFYDGYRQNLMQQADRLVDAIAMVSEKGARRVDNIYNVSGLKGVEVSLRDLLLRPLRKHQIPVVIPVAYSEDSNGLEIIPANKAAVALTKEFAGLNVKADPENDPESTKALFQSLQQQISLDRIITIDKAGGIPKIESADRKHVFVNLEQEFDSILTQLGADSELKVINQPAINLTLLRDTLQLLPPSSSGLMTTHEEAANPSRITNDNRMSSVGTRRQKNALIHNLLTDKPVYSASLPSGRINQSGREINSASVSTFVKRGMPVTILPNPLKQPWTGTAPRIKLTDPRIDLSRLVHLIEDSFNRKLDVDHYLRRVNDRIAGVIIAGEYEGGALLTWETPKGVDSQDTERLVPYLDKFAVLKRSQGGGGVADIVFNAMVRTCFPDGVCWRSRKDNPVNKWYFERSRGTWKIPDMNWTMFWTTSGVDESSQAFHDYESVCRGVEPSWADKRKAAD